jgi:hypothetical protein
MFTEVTLKPTVTIAEGSDPELAKKLHEKAHHLCFIASSVNFPVRTEPAIVVAGARPGRAHKVRWQVVKARVWLIGGESCVPPRSRERNITPNRKSQPA